MEDDSVSSRPESPKKKIKSNPSADSEAQPSNYSKSRDSSDEYNFPHLNGSCTAPTRRGRISPVPDSSSERSWNELQEDRSPPRIQEEEVSSSENLIVRGKRRHRAVTEGDADSVSKESEDFTAICDSASSDSVDKH